MNNKIKHLEMIQGVITRMASNSFIIKGWSVTGIGAMYAYWISTQNHWLLVLILCIVILFWIHDSYYLWLERGFRGLYDKVRQMNDEEIDFGMKPVFQENCLCAFVRPVLLGSYGLIILATLILLYIFK